MTWVTIDEIKHDLADYLQRVGKGETLVITQAGKPFAELKPVTNGTLPRRPFGLCAGEFIVPDDFDDALPDSILTKFASTQSAAFCPVRDIRQ
jgi:prevent-host-death family protein